eukprot:scaffold73238_cov31-Tisochrysis_lutea.AAC.3
MRYSQSASRMPRIVMPGCARSRRMPWQPASASARYIWRSVAASGARWSMSSDVHMTCAEYEGGGG